MEPASAQEANSGTSGIVVNKNVLGMSELRPRPVMPDQQQGCASPGASSMYQLIDSPRPGSKPPVATSEIMPLLLAQYKKERSQKVKSLVISVLKIPTLIGLLYVFICSLDFLSTSFRLIAGKAAGE